MAVVLVTSGTTGQTAGGAESNIWPNGAAILGEFQIQLDLNLLAAGDVIELRVYKMVKASGTARVLWYASYSGAQAADAQIVVSDWIANTLTDSNAVEFAIKQTFGTTRALPYAVLNRLDFTTAPASANVTQWNSQAVPTPNVNGVPIVDDKYLLGTVYSTPATAGIQDINVKNMNNVSAAAITTVKAVQGLTTADTVVTVSGNVNGNVGGNVTGSVGSVVGAVGSVTGAVGSVTGNVGGNVTGSVGSVVGAVGSVTGNVGGNVTGSVGTVVGAVGSVAGNVVGSVGSVVGLTAANLDATITSRATPAQVLLQVQGALSTDTYAEPGQGTPAATTSLAAKIGYLYKFMRNRITQTSSAFKVYNDDAVTVDQKATFSDDGTTADRGEISTGP